MNDLKKGITTAAVILGLLAAYGPAAHAQTTGTTPGTTAGTTTTTTADDGFDWGWLGLIGLAGLAGLRRRDPNDVTVRR